ncbi:MAG: hypothetical protein QOK24_2743 [Verrucomicrobiota bacterium]|jgi:hypothetical protein
MLTPSENALRWLKKNRWGVGSAIMLTILAGMCIANDSRPAPRSVAVVPAPSKFDAFMVQTGNIKVTFVDGHAEMWTENGNAILPKISYRGHIGWVELDKSQIDIATKNRAGQDKLVIRLNDGARREFVMTRDTPFIANWSFADDDTAVSVLVSGHHGPRSYVEYDLRSGRVKGEIAGYASYETLPTWAKQVSDDRSNQ